MDQSKAASNHTREASGDVLVKEIELIRHFKALLRDNDTQHLDRSQILTLLTTAESELEDLRIETEFNPQVTIFD